jgi:hypothetical protein
MLGLCNDLSKSYIIWLWAGHVARMGEKKNTYRILVRKPEGKRPLENQDVGGWAILKWIFER